LLDREVTSYNDEKRGVRITVFNSRRCSVRFVVVKRDFAVVDRVLLYHEESERPSAKSWKNVAGSLAGIQICPNVEISWWGVRDGRLDGCLIPLEQK
jgi:hypothetical protein